MSAGAGLIERARAFIQGDPDPEGRAELEALVRRAESGDPAASAELDDRFRGPLQFGTAGLRGLLGAGESRMNEAVVVRATHGLVEHAIASIPRALERGIVIGRDGRRMSKELQRAAAEVALARGMRVHLFEELGPTPATAFAVTKLGAAAGVMVTASHNPPAYNGYKVYWENGAQIIPPHDAAIARAIDAAPPAIAVPRRALEPGSYTDATPMFDAYLDAIAELRVVEDAPVDRLVIAYSAMHGVGEKLFRRALSRRGFVHVHSVKEQAEPDGSFPTVEFPNPEEPGALDRVLALAKEVSADVVLVNDPDADRLGVAARAADGSYAVLNGNEIGLLLGHYLLARGRDRSPERLVMATIVSSQGLRRVAGELGARYAETLTGFKWIANEAARLEAEEGARFVFGYEEALGYTVGTVVRDKDGISAALVMAELAAVLKGEGRTLLDELEAIRRRFGLFLSRQKSVTLVGREGAEKMARATAAFRRGPIAEIGGTPVASVWDLEAGRRVFADGREAREDRWRGDVVILDLAGGGRISVRPSGTEPKIKLYFEIMEPLAPGEPMREAEARGRARLAELERATLAMAGLAAG